MEENMKTLLSSTAAILAISITPALAAANSNGYDAHERCKKNEDTRQVLGGVAGAVLGGVVGSQVSGNGARTDRNDLCVAAHAAIRADAIWNAPARARSIRHDAIWVQWLRNDINLWWLAAFL